MNPLQNKAANKKKIKHFQVVAHNKIRVTLGIGKKN
jgi:hypothetical protein